MAQITAMEPLSQVGALEPPPQISTLEESATIATMEAAAPQALAMEETTPQPAAMAGYYEDQSMTMEFTEAEPGPSSSGDIVSAHAIEVTAQEGAEDQPAKSAERRRKAECTETELFTCPAEGCEKTFASHAGLYLHKRSKHPEIIVARAKLQDCANPHTCPVPGCGKTFVSAGGLCLHRQSKHPDMPHQPRGRKKRVPEDETLVSSGAVAQVAAAADAQNEPVLVPQPNAPPDALRDAPTDAALQPEATLQTDAALQSEAALQPEAALQVEPGPQPDQQPEAALPPETTLLPETTLQPEPTLQPDDDAEPDAPVMQASIEQDAPAPPESLLPLPE